MEFEIHLSSVVVGLLLLTGTDERDLLEQN